MEVQVTSSIPMKYLSLSRVRVCGPAVAIVVWTCNISFFCVFECGCAGLREQKFYIHSIKFIYFKKFCLIYFSKSHD